MAQEQLETFVPTPMTPREKDLLNALRTHLTLNHESEFTTDTLWELQFDRFIPQDKLGVINFGALIHKLQYFRHIRRTGRSVCSKRKANHGHRIEVWQLKNGA